MQSANKQKKSLLKKIEEIMLEIFREEIIDDEQKVNEANRKVVKTHKQFVEELKIGDNLESIKPKTEERKKTIQRER